MIRKRPSRNQTKVIVTFELPGSTWADQIHLVGDFNDWDRENLPFQITRHDTWQVELELNRGLEYHFRYLIDGNQWRSDRHADRMEEGTDGGYDSVVIGQLPGAA